MGDNSNLKTKTISGMIWSFVQRFGTMIIAFVSNIVLARLLTPDDYGTIGMLAIFIAIANTFVDGGFGSALIQKKDPTKEDYSTIFWWNMFLSIFLYFVLYLCAPAIARFYNIPLLSSVLRIQGLVLIINALSIIQQNQLRKQLKFRQLAVIMVISTSLSVCIAIVLAFLEWGVWALVVQQLSSSLFIAIMLWLVNKWYPYLIFSKKSFKELFSFGGFILLSSLINTICSNIQGLLIGKFFSPSILGYYTQARKLEEVTSSSVSTIVDQVSYPILSEIQDDSEKLVRVLKKITSIIAFVSVALMAILIALAYPLILFLYSEKWLASVPYLQILCVAGIAISLQRVHYSAVASIGESKDLFVWTVVKRVLGLVVIILGMCFWGIYGLLWGCVANSWIILIINATLTSKHIQYGLKQQIKDLLPILAIGIVAYYTPLLFLNMFELSDILNSIIHCLLLVVVYMTLSHAFKIDSYIQLRQLLADFYLKKVKRF